jgi:hypothetical protein
MPVPVPQKPGTYAVRFWAQSATNVLLHEISEPALRLVVESVNARTASTCCGPLLDQAEAAIVEAQRLQRLPDTYIDVTLGWLPRWKRWLKRKLLGNFKHAYVDVLSQQQSAVNGQLVTALRELTECCATLDHAVRQFQDRLQDSDIPVQLTLAHTRCGEDIPPGEQKAGAECSPAEKPAAARAP